MFLKVFITKNERWDIFSPPPCKLGLSRNSIHPSYQRKSYQLVKINKGYVRTLTILRLCRSGLSAKQRLWPKLKSLIWKVLFGKKTQIQIVVVHIYPLGQRQTLANYWMIGTLFIAVTTSCLEESAPCYRIFQDPMFLRIFSHSWPMNLLLVRSHRAEIIIVKRLIHGHNKVTRVRVGTRSCNQSRRKNDLSTLSATLPTRYMRTVLALRC